MLNHDEMVRRQLRRQVERDRALERGRNPGIFRATNLIGFGAGGLGGIQDPNYAYAVLAMHMETLLDEKGHSMTAVANAAISSSVFKYGYGSLSCPDANSYVYGPSSSDWTFGTGDWTVEAWVYITDGGQHTIASNINGQVSQDDLSFQIEIYTNKIRLTGWSTIWMTSTGTLSNNTWTHVEISRTGTNGYMFINGSLDAGGAAIGGLNLSNVRNLYIGAFLGGAGTPSGQLNGGYIDELRIYKGLGKHTSSFTAPSSRLLP